MSEDAVNSLLLCKYVSVLGSSEIRLLKAQAAEANHCLLHCVKKGRGKQVNKGFVKVPFQRRRPGVEERQDIVAQDKKGNCRYEFASGRIGRLARCNVIQWALVCPNREVVHIEGKEGGRPGSQPNSLACGLERSRIYRSVEMEIAVMATVRLLW